MKLDRRSSALIIGMALFAMFFGSGNLIYPLFIGTQSFDAWLSTTLGFVITAVVLPFLGVIAMVLNKGDYDSFFNAIGKKFGFILTLILLTIWIPLGSGPRCMTLAFASLESYFGYIPGLWIFSLLYSLLVFIVISRRVGVLDFLGKFITPLLLVCIGLISYAGLSSLPTIHLSQPFDFEAFKSGIVEGYNTMDLIASFFFSASVIHIIKESGGKITQTLSLVFKSSIIGMAILAFVYLCLICISAHYYQHITEIPKDQLLAYLSRHILGSGWGFVPIIAILLACFSTSIALIIVYTDFLHEEIFQARNHPAVSLFLSLAATYVMSLFGLAGITFVTAPLLKICYPLLLLLIILDIGKFIFKKKSLEQSPSQKEEQHE